MAGPAGKDAEGMTALLKKGAEALGVRLTSGALEGFALYNAELVKWNRKVNLTAITDPRDIVVKHFLDSIALCRAMPEGGLEGGLEAADIGSGAGFPGLAVKLARPDIRVTLIEPAAKKAAFLRQVVRLLGLDKVEVVAERVEELGPKHAGRYDMVFSRAFKDPAALFPVAAPLLKEGGLVVVSLGPSAPHAPPGGWEIVHDEEITLPHSKITRRVISSRKA